MAKTISVPSNVYPVGTYQSSVDSFPIGVTQLRVSLTRESWPGVNSDDVMNISVKWNDGSGMEAALPGGIVLNRDGSEMLVQTMYIGVPQISIGGVKQNKNVVGGEFIMTINQQLRTAITVEAL